jgi:hypothetical protein
MLRDLSNCDKAIGSCFFRPTVSSHSLPLLTSESRRGPPDGTGCGKGASRGARAPAPHPTPRPPLLPPHPISPSPPAAIRAGPEQATAHVYLLPPTAAAVGNHLIHTGGSPSIAARLARYSSLAQQRGPRRVAECQLDSLASEGPTAFGCPLGAGSEEGHELPACWRSPH